MRRILCFFLIIVFADAWCADSSKIKKSVKVAPKNKKKGEALGVDQSDFMPDEGRFGFILSYGLSYNDLEQVDEKTLNHNLNLSTTYSFSQSKSVYASVGASHRSFNDKIYRDSEADEFHEVSNFNVGFVNSTVRPLPFIRRSSDTLNISLPVSRRSKIDGHRGSFSFADFLQTDSWHGIAVFNRLSANFLWNSQKFSLVNNDTLNRDWLLSNSLGLTYFPFRWLGFRAAMRVDYVRFLDETWNQSFGNGFAIFSFLYGFQVSLSMTNRSYPENERIDIGFYDPYRRFYRLGITYAF